MRAMNAAKAASLAGSVGSSPTGGGQKRWPSISTATITAIASTTPTSMPRIVRPIAASPSVALALVARIARMRARRKRASPHHAAASRPPQSHTGRA